MKVLNVNALKLILIRIGLTAIILFSTIGILITIIGLILWPVSSIFDIFIFPVLAYIATLGYGLLANWAFKHKYSSGA